MITTKLRLVDFSYEYKLGHVSTEALRNIKLDFRNGFVDFCRDDSRNDSLGNKPGGTLKSVIQQHS